VENELSFTEDVNDFIIRVSGGHSYTLSTNDRSTAPNDASVGKQLIYVPENNFNGNFSITYKGLNVYYNHSFVGIRYTSSDNIGFLDEYHLGTLYAGQQFKLDKFGGELYGRINNVWNDDYQVIAGRPMARWNYNVGIKIDFNHKPKNNEP